MNISPVNYNPHFALRGTQNNQPTPKHEMIGNTKIPYTPATIGALNGVLWTGIGLAFDKVFSILTKTKRSMKSSLFVNGVIGVGMGIFSYVSAKKDFAKAQAVAPDTAPSAEPQKQS